MAAVASMLHLAGALSVIFVGVPSVQSVEFVYHRFPELEATLWNLTASYPNLTRLYSIGQSVQGRDLWVIAIGQSPDDHVPMRPHVRYIANMHGNEAVGRELLLHFADFLLSNYGVLQNVTDLLDSTTVHLLPSMNPDGFEMAMETDCFYIQGRGNANGYDLNRNFPDYWEINRNPIQLETEHIMNWFANTTFALSANLHGGSMVANYPFDNYAGDDVMPRESTSPDNDVLRHLALTYSRSHTIMHRGLPCPYHEEGFPDGITNGAAWYTLKGGIQDYSYIFDGVMDITVELSCCKYPPAQDLEAFWRDNRDALLSYVQQVHMGVKGMLQNSDGYLISNAELSIKGRELIKFRSSQNGEFWRVLLPGNYTLKVCAEGFGPIDVPFNVTEGEVTILNIQLEAHSNDTKELGYHNYSALKQELESLHQQYPNLTHLYSIGKSVEGRELLVLAIGESPQSHVPLRPHVQFVGNVHGNEAVGREMLVELMRHLLSGYGENSSITQTLQSTVIHILPSLNPDGFEAAIMGQCHSEAGRTNANGVELSRNFPNLYKKNSDTELQPETSAFIGWFKKHAFAMSVNIHGKGKALTHTLKMVARGQQSERGEDDVFRHIVSVYSGTRHTGRPRTACPCSAGLARSESNNTRNSYPRDDGMQDYVYHRAGVLAVSVGVGCCKYPNASDLQGYLEDSQGALVPLLQQINVMGVRGVVRNRDGSSVRGALLSIYGRGTSFTTSHYGEFWRMLLPGDYILKVSAAGYDDSLTNFRVLDQSVTTLNVSMEPVKLSSAATDLKLFDGSLEFLFLLLNAFSFLIL